MNPYIEVKDRSIISTTNYNDPNFDDNASLLLHVFVSENLLKVLFTIKWQDPNLNLREFQVVKLDQLYLDGQDKTKQIGQPPYTGNLSADVSIVQNLFADNLDPYGIILDKITVHNKVFFESTKFRLADNVKKNALYDLINQTCLKSIKRVEGYFAL